MPPLTIKDLNDKTEFDDRQYLNKELKEMFFALKLIQSYGSGIRRAKKAMEDNNSPKLVFEPEQEDEKDYTMVTAYLNEEFASIKAEEEGTEKAEQEEKTTQKTTQKTRMIVLDRIRNNPTITRDELSQRIGITPDGIKYHISKLKEAGIIERIGGDKGGYLKIND